MDTLEAQHSKRSSKLLVLFAWLFVGIPLSWGVYQTAYKSMSLFKAAPSTAVPTTTAR